MISYSVVIRTLGKAGDLYQKLLDSINSQTCKPKNIFVFIANGYPIPQETIGHEEYRFVKKGMVAQRALLYDEVDTEYILFLDDDVFLPKDAVERLYKRMLEYNADVVAPDTFPNYKRNRMTKIKMALIGKSYARKNDMWAYKALRNGGYSYNESPIESTYISQLNAGPCFFCRKESFLSIHFEEELWLDEAPYALPEDQVMFYKFYRLGYRILTLFDSGIIHLDAGSTNRMLLAKECDILYSESRNKLIYWHRFFYLPENSIFYLRMLNVLCIFSSYFTRYILMLCKFKFREAKSWIKGIRDGLTYIKSIEYKNLPVIPANN